MKLNIKNLIILATATASFAACSEDFLTVPAEGKALTSNYYKNEAEAFSGLVATYDIMKKNSGGFENMIAMLNAGSDDHFAGGGGDSDGRGIQSFSNYSQDAYTIPQSFWNDHFQGVFRANILLQKVPSTTMDANVKI